MITGRGVACGDRSIAFYFTSAVAASDAPDINIIVSNPEISNGNVQAITFLSF